MHGRGGGRAPGGKRAGPTIYELHSHGKRRSAREIPRLVAAGIAICWRAGRRELITLGVLELLSGAGVAAEVVVGRQVLQAFLLTGDAASSGGGGIGRRVEQRVAECGTVRGHHRGARRGRGGAA
jgi:hypothetical protein